MRRAGCPTCGASLEPRRVALEAEQGAVRALVEETPVLACPAGHEEYEVAPSLGGEILADVRAGLLVAERSRLPWRPQRCAACKEPLTMPGRRTTRSVTVTSAAGRPFTVTFDLPLLRCTECVAENLPSEVWADIEAATLAALAGT